MNTRRENADGPEDIDAAFAEIVAGLEKDAPMQRWPEDVDSGSATGTRDPAPAAGPETTGADRTDSAATGPRDWEPPGETEDEGHFEPPDPPPLPTPGLSTLGGVAVIVLGLALLAMPGLAGVSTAVALPLGLVAISAGITWLLFRIRRGPPSSEDDGAQL